MYTTSRRAFIQQTALVAAAASLSPHTITTGEQYNNEKKLNVALVGLGRYATILAEGLQDSKYCRLAGIVTGHPEKAQAWQQQYQIPPGNIYNYSNFDTIASNAGIDLIYIVLPNALHKEYTIRSAKAGKHVICEKPMALTSQDCVEMLAACCP